MYLFYIYFRVVGLVGIEFISYIILHLNSTKFNKSDFRIDNYYIIDDIIYLPYELWLFHLAFYYTNQLYILFLISLIIYLSIDNILIYCR